jgi:glycosyltransferase involved in cell wall biosynthesis
MILGFDATTLVGRLSGVGYYTARLMEGLAAGAGDGIVTRLVVLSNREVPVAPQDGTLEVHTSGRFGVRSVWMQFVLPWILRRVRPDLVHFTNYLAPLACPVPYVVSVHDMSLSLLPQYHTVKKRLLTSTLVPSVARAARMVLAPSESTRRDIVRLLGLDPARVRVVPYAPGPAFAPQPPDAQRLARAYGVAEPYFVYVGTLEPRKNLTRALRAFATLAAALPDHRFVLAGQPGWHCDDVLAEVQAAAGRVLLLGYVPEEDLPLLYSHAVAMVYPSLYEGFGLPVVEAMACGTPVITSRSSSLEEIARDAAALVDPLDERSIAEAMHAVATDPALRASLRTRGLARAASFTWARTARETAEVYGEALALGGRAAP